MQKESPHNGRKKHHHIQKLHDFCSETARKLQQTQERLRVTMHHGVTAKPMRNTKNISSMVQVDSPLLTLLDYAADSSLETAFFQLLYTFLGMETSLPLTEFPLFRYVNHVREGGGKGGGKEQGDKDHHTADG